MSTVIKKSIVLRIRIAFIFILFGAVMVVFRIFTIQYIEGDDWRRMGNTHSIQTRNTPAIRGNIHSDDGSLLATSLPFYYLAIDPSLPSDDLYKKNIDSLSYRLSRYYKDLTATQYKEKISEARKSGRKYLILNRQDIGYQDKKRMEKWPLFREGRLRGGIIFEKIKQRFLPFSHLGARTIGKLNEEGNGKVGLEFSFNKKLAGTDGKGFYQKMSGGGWRPIYDGTEKQPINGYDIQTTINIDLQDITESALLTGLRKHEADYGVAVVMEVKTGEIKAISNLSSDNSKGGRYFERYNYAVASLGSREPGSTFKLASMLALLEETKIKLTDSIDVGSDEFEFFDITMRDHKSGGFGKLTIQEVFEKSSNIGIAKLVSHYFGSEPEKFINYLKRMKLHQILDFQLKGEGKPYIKDPSDSTWSGVSLPWMSHGYELKMTPMQILTLYNAVANDGKMLKPMIVKGVMKADRMIKEFETEVINKKIASKETIKKLRLMLEGVVERGTAKNIKNSHYKIAGKTGTAKRVRNGEYVNEYYTSFAGYFPAQAPRYSCIVVIDDPKKGKIYGSDVSAPVFKEIADRIYSIELDIHEIETEEYTQVTGVFPHIKAGKRDELTMICDELGISNHTDSKSKWVKTAIVNNSVYWKKNEVEYEFVPDVRGMTLRDAIYVLENLGLIVAVNRGRGRVVTQSITPGDKITKGITIKLIMS